jgi:phosphatidate phosphatase LPIN
VSLDLLSLNKYKSSYVTMQELLDHFFPPTSLLVHDGGEEYTDFTYWRNTPHELEDFSTTDSEDEEEDAEDVDQDLAEEEEDDGDDDGDYDEDLSDGEGSEYLDETQLAEEDLGASYISQDSAALSNPAGSIIESVEGDLGVEEGAIGEEELSPVAEEPQEASEPSTTSLPIRSKMPQKP